MAEFPEQSKCTFANCDRLFDDVKQMKKHKESNPEHHYCRKCDIDFENDIKHIIHRLQTPRKHITCPMCAQDFKSRSGLDAHCDRSHKSSQRIHCQACNAVFDSITSIMEHILKNQCEISRNEWQDERVQRQVQREAFEERNDEFISSHLNPRANDQDGGVSALQHPLVPLQNMTNQNITAAELAQLSSGMSTLTTNDDQSTISGPTPPADSVISTAQTDASNTTSLAGRRTFKLIDFYDPVRDIYVCPGRDCKRTFKSDSNFHKHLLSPAHLESRVQCRSCLKKFTSVVALCAHMESPSQKCNIRHSVNYNQVLREVTAGIVGTGGFNADGTVKYIMPGDEGWVD